MTTAEHAHIPGTVHAVDASGRTLCGWQTTHSKSWQVVEGKVSCRKCADMERWLR